MSSDPVLESLASQVLAPLSGDVGEDLSQTSSSDLIEIRNQFTDRSRDFPRLFEVGREILANQSKDLWALWALVGGLLWSKQFDQAQSFACSCRIVTGFCERYWAKFYPDSLGLRNTLLSNINKWWNTYLVRSSDGADPQVLREAFEEIRKLEQLLKDSVGGEDPQDNARRFPMLANLKQVSQTLESLVQSKPEDTPAPPAGDSAPATQEDAKAAPPATEQPAATASDVPPPAPQALDVAFETALRGMSEGQTAQALQTFQQSLERQGEFSARFRGQVLLGELYLKAGLPTHAKRVLQHAHDQINEIRLPQWEPKLCTRLWSALIEANQKLEKDEKPDGKLLADLFAQICRIDPATAAELQPLREK